MTGILYIDGIDVFDRFRVFVTDGGYASLVSYPPLKAVEYVDWPEEDGIDADLSAPRLDIQTLSIAFGCSNTSLSRSFIELLSDGAYHTFDCRSVGTLRRLRLQSQSARTAMLSLEKFTLSFVDDFPLQGYAYAAPRDLGAPRQGYEIDGRDVAGYGVKILGGTIDEILKLPAVKQNLLVNTKGIAGAVYDGDEVVYQAKDVSVKCLMHLPKEEFWRNYNALLFDLVRPGERGLYVAATREEYPCYYKSAQVSEFDAGSSTVWCKFAITLTFTSFHAGGVNYLLASEGGELFITEDGENYIDIDYGY